MVPDVKAGRYLGIIHRIHDNAWCVRSTDASGAQTIVLDVWTTLVPPNGVAAQAVWSGSAPPDTRVRNRTGQFNMPFDVTLINATTYLVRH